MCSKLHQSYTYSYLWFVFHTTLSVVSSYDMDLCHLAIRGLNFQARDRDVSSFFKIKTIINVIIPDVYLNK